MADVWTDDEEEEFWLFGYGSLIWKPPPNFDRRVPGYVDGYVRRFWQASEDHRGTPAAPGRVVTLIERSFWETLVDQHATTEDHVWGAVYRIESSKVEEVKKYLDIREANGYSIQDTDFHPADPSLPPIKCTVYIGLPHNPQFMGAQDPQALAEHISRSAGPSGENKEYLFMLEEALEDLSDDSGDAHVTDLARRVKAIEELSLRSYMDEGSTGYGITDHAVAREINRVESGESKHEQEEVEKLR
ncbi:MAG: cation transporter [Lasallia pustulata]|uniref:glutathione-specific gamma-glutamylcyclotransferase n=1 Tax=Lasallia pustulata TaxID=136370 RepID=A0A5M8Q493_9LECA|nr:MAG: cation transporter [Lasallia pustulata]